jgi:hypothetical protein
MAMMNLRTPVMNKLFLELLQFLGKYNKENNKVVLENAHENHRMTAQTFKNKKKKQLLQQLRLYMILLNIWETHCLLS